MNEIKIGPRDVDYLGGLKFSDLCGHIVFTAGLSAYSKGYGVKDLKKKGLTWVLSGLAVDYLETIHEGDSIYIKTWLEKINRLYTYRHFEVYNQHNTMVATATSTWSMIDFKERTLVNILTLVDKDDVNGVGSPSTPIERVINFESQREINHLVRYSDLDTNQHANSIHYISWVLDGLELEQIANIARLDINYLKEILYNETVSIAYRTEGDKTLYAVKDSEGKVCCCGTIHYKKEE